MEPPLDPPAFDLPMVQRCIHSTVRIAGRGLQDVLILTTLRCSVAEQLDNFDLYGSESNNDVVETSSSDESSSDSSSDEPDDASMDTDDSDKSVASDCAPSGETQHSPMRAFWLGDQPQRPMWDHTHGFIRTRIYLARILQKAAQHWEITDGFFAIKMVSWNDLRNHRGLVSENFVQEVSALHRISEWRDNEMPGREIHVLTPDIIMSSETDLCFVTPYSPDGCMCMKVATEGRLAEDDVKFWFRQIVKGLETLQRAHICHRDLSPENILIFGNTCYIIDLGMCIRVPYSEDGRHLITGQRACGKKPYVAPEIMSGEPLDSHAVDIWAAGTILLFMLTQERLDQPPQVDNWFESSSHNLKLSDNATDLLKHIFRLRPVDRLSLQEIQNHPFLAQ